MHAGYVECGRMPVHEGHERAQRRGAEAPRTALRVAMMETSTPLRRSPRRGRVSGRHAPSRPGLTPQSDRACVSAHRANLVWPYPGHVRRRLPHVPRCTRNLALRHLPPLSPRRVPLVGVAPEATDQARIRQRDRRRPIHRIFRHDANGVRGLTTLSPACRPPPHAPHP